MDHSSVNMELCKDDNINKRLPPTRLLSQLQPEQLPHKVQEPTSENCQQNLVQEVLRSKKREIEMKKVTKTRGKKIKTIKKRSVITVFILLQQCTYYKALFQNAAVSPFRKKSS